MDEIEKALNIPDAEILAIHDRMFKRGYTGELSKLDKIMYKYLGEDIYNKMGEISFNYSALEANFLGISTHSEIFRRMCKVNRNAMWESSKSVLPYMLNGGKIIELQEVSEEYMREIIRKKWQKPLGNV